MTKQNLSLIEKFSSMEIGFYDYDDLIYIVEKQLEEKDVATVSLDDLISNVGYVPSHIIENELPKEFIEQYGTVDDYGDLEEIESFPTQDWYYVEWINTEDDK